MKIICYGTAILSCGLGLYFGFENVKEIALISLGSSMIFFGLAKEV